MIHGDYGNKSINLTKLMKILGIIVGFISNRQLIAGGIIMVYVNRQVIKNVNETALIYVRDLDKNTRHGMDFIE